MRPLVLGVFVSFAGLAGLACMALIATAFRNATLSGLGLGIFLVLLVNCLIAARAGFRLLAGTLGERRRAKTMRAQ